MLSRTFSPKSHVAAMLYCQVSKTESLNSICDIAYANEPLWRSMGVTPPMRNTLSNANARRPSGMAKDLYWRTFNHLTGIAPRFGRGPHRGYCFRIKAPMFAVDSSTIKLTMNSFDWAQHRRSKAAAKLHLTFDLGSLLPSFAIVEDAAHHDSARAAELTAHPRKGDIAVADRAYTDFGFMNGLDARGVWFVTRQKRNMKMTVVRELQTPAVATDEKKTQILKDEIVVPAKKSTAAKYKGTLRRVTAVVELLRKIRRHRGRILNTIRFGLSNARIEATNNKSKLLLRIAYGFRNIDTMISLVMLFCSSIEIPWPDRKRNELANTGLNELMRHEPTHTYA